MICWTLPYSETTFREQPYASKTQNIQPYDVIDYIGNVTLTPEMDEWMETETLPDLQVTMLVTFDTLTDLAAARSYRFKFRNCVE